jgi:putative serine protease PepD
MSTLPPGPPLKVGSSGPADPADSPGCARAKPLPPPPPPILLSAAQSQPWSSGWRRALAVLVATVTVSTGSFLGAWVGAQAIPASPAATPPPVSASPTSPALLVPSAADFAIATILPSTVTVLTSGSMGTGVVFSADGEILTNAHVVEDQTQLRVLLHQEVDPRPARLVAMDTESDLAVLRIDATGLTPATFSTTVTLGQEVIAVGYALGLEGEPTVTQGIISATRRTIAAGGQVLSNLLQTDAPISSGNSGGPLVNSAGEVVGINTAVYQSSQETAASNIGFAVRSDTALAVAEQLRSGRLPQPALLGISVTDREDGGRGGLVLGIDPAGPAAAAGIEEGDIILQVADIPIGGRASLVGAVRTRAPGDVVEITFARASEIISVTVTLAAAPK